MTMRQMLTLMFAVMLSVTASERGIVLEDTKTCWDEPVQLRVVDGYLCMTVDGEHCQPVAVKEGFVDAVRALEASGERYDLDPSRMHGLMALLDDSLTGGAEPCDIDVQSDQIFLFLEGSGDGLTLRVAEWNGAGYDVLDNPTFPASSEMDTIHYDDMMEIWVEVGELDAWTLYVYRSYDGVWRTDVREDMPADAWDYEWRWQSVVERAAIEDGRNDGYFYGEFPFVQDLKDFDAAGFPSSVEEAVAAMDRSGWAVVNNPNPKDRLNLRVSPDKDAKTLGKFYNKTPVRVVGAKGEWTEVVIGEESNALTGWMMTKYLAFGEDMDEVACAFPGELALKDGESRCAARAVPDESTRQDWAFYPDSDFVIGVLGDEWYIVMEPHVGWVGYVPQDWLTKKAP